jgi:hypothetical protein
MASTWASLYTAPVFALFEAGFRPIGLMVGETAWIGLLVLASIEIVMRP